MKVSYNLDFIHNISFIFPESKEIADSLDKALSFVHFPNLKVIFLGFPRYDLYENINYGGEGHNHSQFSKTVMWLPRWTTNDSVASTTFFKYKDSIIKYFLEHKDLRLICRPHPLMLRNFLSTGEMTQAEVDSFLKVFADEDNFTYDDNPDYMQSLQEADIFISDLTSLMFEEFITGKPTIYLGSLKGLNKEARKISSFFYRAENEKQIFSYLEDLLNGNDSTKQQRQEYIRNEMNVDYKSGERIIEYLKKDFHG